MVAPHPLSPTDRSTTSQPFSRRADIRSDIKELIDLIRSVEGRREGLATAGRPTADADDLLRTLRNGLRSVLPLRGWRAIRRDLPAPAPGGTAWSRETTALSPNA